MAEKLNLEGKLLMIQSELKAPKGQYNTFGKYKYRSCEDILEAVKPLCVKYATVLTVEDEIVNIGERFYIKATAKLSDCEGNETITISAFAREADTKTGMDLSQLTGATSSYARKYALNGMFCIDDTKDADTDEYAAKQQSRSECRKKVIAAGKEKGLTEKQLAQEFNLTRDTTKERFEEVLKELEGK